MVLDDRAAPIIHVKHARAAQKSTPQPADPDRLAYQRIADRSRHGTLKHDQLRRQSRRLERLLADRATLVWGLFAGAQPDYWWGLLFVFVFFFLLNIAPAPLGLCMCRD